MRSYVLSSFILSTISNTKIFGNWNTSNTLYNTKAEVITAVEGIMKEIDEAKLCWGTF